MKEAMAPVDLHELFVDDFFQPNVNLQAQNAAIIIHQHSNVHN